MGPKAQGQLLCSFGFNVKETDEADKKDGPGIMKAEMMNGVMQLVPEYIVLTDRQTQAIRKEISVFNRVCAMQLQGAWQFQVFVGEGNYSPYERPNTISVRQDDV